MGGRPAEAGVAAPNAVAEQDPVKASFAQTVLVKGGIGPSVEKGAV